MSPTTPTMAMLYFKSSPPPRAICRPIAFLRRAEEALGEGQIDDGDSRIALGIRVRELAAHQQRLLQRGEVPGVMLGDSLFMSSSSAGL